MAENDEKPVQYTPKAAVIQSRAPGGVWTSPFRDVTYLFPRICRHVCEEFHQMRPIVEASIAEFKVTPDEINQVGTELARLINNAHNKDVVSPFLVFSNNTTEKAKAVYGYFFLRHLFFNFVNGVRNVTHKGQDDAPDFTPDIEAIEATFKRPTFMQKLKAIWRIIRF